MSVESEYGRRLETAFAKSTNSPLPLRGKRKHCEKLASLLFFWVCRHVTFYLCSLSVAMIQHFDQKQPGKDRAHLADPSISRPITEAGAGCRTEAEAVEKDAHGPGCYGLLQWLSSVASDHLPRSGSAHSGLDPSPKSWMEKMPP